jgi:hypothetical protein
MPGLDVRVADRGEASLDGGQPDPALRLDGDVGCNGGRFSGQRSKAIVAAPGLE